MQAPGAGRFLPITLDNFNTGHREVVKWGPLLDAYLHDPVAAGDALSHNNLQAIMHFAALPLVGESVAQPERYLRNNVAGTRHLLAAMRRAGVDRLVFWSTAAVYGNPATRRSTKPIPSTRSIPMARASCGPNARSRRHARARACAPRACAISTPPAPTATAKSASLTRPRPTSPQTYCWLRSTRPATRGPATLHGDDYDTPDGSCVRDYVYVEGLREAHLLALEVLTTNAPGTHHALNLDTGHGNSFA